MGNLTKSGVCYQLEDSPFYYDYDEFRFYFSSNTHRNNFIKKLPIKRDWLIDSLSRRFHVAICCGLVAAFQLYTQVESRGFYVVRGNGRIYTKASDIVLTVTASIK